MGNHRFRLSNMMPNAWFYKLKDMSRGSRGHNIPNSNKRSQPPRTTTTTPPKPIPAHQQVYLPNRTSYYFPSREQAEKLPNSPVHPKASDTHFPIEPPRISKRRSRKLIRPSTKLVSSSVSSGCACRAALSSVCKSEFMPESLPHHRNDSDDLRKAIIAGHAEINSIESWNYSCNCRVTSSATDIIINMDSKSSSNQRFEKLVDFDPTSELDLPPILTKPMKKAANMVEFDGSNASSEHGNNNKGNSLNEHSSAERRIPSSGAHRIKIRASSPRVTSKKIEANQRWKTPNISKAAMQQRKGLTESFAIVKSSSDPQRDFRESMVEMIVENNIRAAKDLEELLACYLSLNSDEYHDVIVKVFKQIWFDLNNTRF